MSRSSVSSRGNGAGLERTESYSWPSAHIGHLSEGQQAQLDQFKKLCAEKGYYAPASDGGKTPATHDDETLLRYLRARKFVPQEAFDQFKDTEDWRKENELDKLYQTIDVDEYEHSRRLYPQWTGRRDKRGIPFYVYEIGQVDAKAVMASGSDKKSSSTASLASASKTQTPPKMLRLFALYENLCRFVLPMCSAMPDRTISETPVSQSSNLVDLSKVGLTKFWSLRNHMSDASTLATAHYPETLDRIFVVGAPSFFPTVWEWAKKWFDPITVSKIFILSDKNMKSTLEQYIDLDNIPKKYGGNLNWEFGDLPFLDPGIVKSLKWEESNEQKGHKTIPIGPIKWKYDDNGDLAATAIGSEHGKPRNRVIARLHPEAGIARLALSPGAQSTPGESHLASASGASKPLSPAVSRDDGSGDSQRESNDEGKDVGNDDGKTMSAPADYMKPEGEDTSKVTSAPSGYVKPESGENTTQDNATIVEGGVRVAGVPGPASSSNGGTYLNYRNGNDDADLNEGKSEGSEVPPTSRAGTYEVPVRDNEHDVAAVGPDGRKGTSSTRYEQQEQTHASGEMADGTPEMKIDSQGEKQGIMDPRTVGQAPKEHPIPTPESEKPPPPPSYMEQAQNYANTAVEQAKAVPGMVMGAVGMGGEAAQQQQQKKEDAEEKREHEEEMKRRRNDPRIDQMDGKTVEEFLRQKTMSSAEPMKR